MQVNHKKTVTKFKVPNLMRPGLKFDCKKQRQAPFFNKVSNSFKLLEEPFHEIEKTAPNLERPNSRSYKRNTVHRNISEFDCRIDLSLGKISMSKESKKEIKYPSMSMSKRSRIYSLKEEPKMIYGSSFTAIPTYSPFQEGQVEPATYLSLTKLKAINQEIENFTQNLKKTNNEENFKPVNDFGKWLDRIIGKEDKEHDRYEKNILDKIGRKEKRKVRVIHESMWK